jgi:spoIIIJ-associated protein
MSDDTDVTTRPDDLDDHSPNGVEDATNVDRLDNLDATEDSEAAAGPGDDEATERFSEEAERADVESQADADLESQADADLESQADADLEAEGDADDENEGVGPNGSRRAGGSRVRLLEREGEVAADFLERLLDIADLDGDIEVDIDGDRASVAIVDSEDGRVPRRMVGSDGKVLDALQELTRLAVQAETGERSRLMLDIAGHRAQRRAVVVEIAQTAIAEVKTTGTQKALEDMSAFERKIVHDEVAAAGLGSESEGVEPHRHIIVFPA